MLFESKKATCLNRRCRQCSFWGLLLLGVMQLSGCSWFMSQQIQLPVILNAKGMSNVQVTQAVSVTRSSRVEASEQDMAKQFMVVTTIQDSRFQVIGVTTLGQRLFTIKSDVDTVKVERSPGFPDSVPLRQLLALIQLVYWPDAVLDEHYSESWQIIQSSGSKSVVKHRRLVVQARYSEAKPSWKTTINVEHIPAGMMIEITPIEVKHL